MTPDDDVLLDDVLLMACDDDALMKHAQVKVKRKYVVRYPFVGSTRCHRPVVARDRPA